MILMTLRQELLIFGVCRLVVMVGLGIHVSNPYGIDTLSNYIYIDAPTFWSQYSNHIMMMFQYK